MSFHVDEILLLLLARLIAKMWCLTSRERLEVLAAVNVSRLYGREEATSIRISM